jgi:hypothetical protein
MDTLQLQQNAPAKRAAFVRSLEDARHEGLATGLATVEEVEADLRATIEAARRKTG